MPALNTRRRFAAGWGAAALAASAALLAQDGREAEDRAARDDLDRTPVRCLPVTSINRIEAVDDRTLMFFTRGRRAYTNHLARTCPGLERENRFGYSTYGQLCNGDMITVLESRGFGLQPGFTCGLGLFHPTPEQEAERLTDARGPRGGIEAEVVELPEETADDADAPEARSEDRGPSRADAEAAAPETPAGSPDQAAP